MDQVQTTVKRVEGRREPYQLRGAESARGARTLSWSVASSNRLLDAHIREGAPRSLFDGVNQHLLELLNEVETIGVDRGLEVEQLRKVRNLLVKAAHSLAIESEKFSELRLLALTDDLTGFYNRRGFSILAMQQLKVSRRNGQPMLLFFVDVDGLKGTNDRYGHDEGDALLLRCAAALNNTFRDSDILARLGGDEFAGLAMEGADRTCEAILSRLKKSVEKINEHGGLTRLSVSVGTAQFDPQHPVSLSELLTAADCNMYHQKRERMETVAAELDRRTD